ncbi:4-amino-4-deoxy-L-arabinose transferase [Nocardia amikacinitolerans]|uniref:ArnT family glycosyltransferase n=1 Tax=Nocardia amikacinitolerans TaxID=756689 RepID=UPI003557EF37|nr:4-amino-4-deoxy-L-arabinose transferase [Nocardia amikacinitolerans]
MTDTVTTPPPVETARRDDSLPRWERTALGALLLGTAVAYLWNLAANGWANAFYSAAAQAGSQSWTAFLFGSSDAANSITVDKPPASLWLSGLSVRVFGLSSWSIQVPQVLLGVATVALLWAIVRRQFGPTAGLLAGLVMALTPVAALMFRYNNPDALLVFLMVAAAWALLRGIEDGRTRWLVLAGAFIGIGFLTKQLQVLLVVPALALTYLIAGPPKVGTRVLQLFAAGASMVGAAGWWVLIVELRPESARPWIGGSSHNSILELTFGYNGMNRLSGDRGAGSNGAGLTRLFGEALGGQIAWLVPASLVLLVSGIVLCGRAARTNPRRAAFLLWGGWLLTAGAVFSFMTGGFHEYYTVALAPAVAALVGGGSVMLWRQREQRWVGVVLALAVVLTAATAWMVLGRTTNFVPWLRWVVLAAALVATVALLFRVSRRVAVVAVAATAVTGLAGPVAYVADTIARPHTGGMPTAGPSVPHGGLMLGGPPGPNGNVPRPQSNPGVPSAPPGAPGAVPQGGAGAAREVPAGRPDEARKPGDRVLALLNADADAYMWVAATITAGNAASYQLATQHPVMPIGGFIGGDPSPTLDQFQQYVREGVVHYFIGDADSRAPGFGRSESESTKIAQWVRANFAATQVDGVTLYDLTAAR